MARHYSRSVANATKASLARSPDKINLRCVRVEPISRSLLHTSEIRDGLVFRLICSCVNGYRRMMWLRIGCWRSAALAAVPETCTTRTFSTRPSKTATNVGAIRNTPHLKRKLGQHLLVNDQILNQIVGAAQLPALIQRKQAALDAAGLGETDSPIERQQAIVRVLEIGPGTGNLTSALLAIAPNIHVHSVEYDERMVERLKNRFAQEIESKRLVIENVDFENFAFEKELEDKSEVTTGRRRVSSRGRAKARERATAAAAAVAQNALKRFDACVANIPYQLSSIIISRLTNDMFRFPGRMESAVLLVQEEFAQRLIAKPGTQNYSRLSVNTALIADVQSVVPVGRNHFLPPPKVDSRVIKITPKPRTSAESEGAVTVLPEDADEQRFFQRFDTLLRIAFTRKNKTLRAALVNSNARALMGKETQDAFTKEEIMARVEEALQVTGLASKRAVQLPVHDFKCLMDALSARGITFKPSETRHFKE